MTLTRRQFLTRTSMALGAMGLQGAWFRNLAHAATATDHYYVFCYFEGGWDHLLGLDPRDPAVFTDADARGWVKRRKNLAAQGSPPEAAKQACGVLHNEAHGRSLQSNVPHARSAQGSD